MKFEAEGKAEPRTGVEMFPPQRSGRTQIAFEFAVKDQELGKVTFTLVDDWLPKSCDNFIRLCLRDGTPFSYVGTPIHRIVKNVALLGGDVELKTGMAGHSAFKTRFFEDEGFVGRHRAKGVLSMINGGVHSNNSQFLITMSSQPQMDGRNVAIGYVSAGQDVLDAIASKFTFMQRPLEPIVIKKAEVVGRAAGATESAAVKKA